MEKEKKHKLWYTLIFAVLPIIAGTLFYFIFCPEVFFVKIADCMLKAIGITVTRTRIDSLAFKLLRYYLTDLLWAIAVTAALLLTYGRHSQGIAKAVIISASLCIILEVVQLFDFVGLSFSWADVIIQLIGVGIALIGYIFLRIGRAE